MTLDQFFGRLQAALPEGTVFWRTLEEGRLLSEVILARSYVINGAGLGSTLMLERSMKLTIISEEDPSALGN